MTSWRPADLSPRGPVYIAIADALARDVEAGELRPGDRLPTHRALAAALGVNVVTVTRAYAEAARRGLVEGEVGRGTFVRLAPAERAPFLPSAPAGGADVRVDLEHGVPWGDPALLDPGRLLAGLAAEPAAAHLEAGYVPEGLPAHREAGAAWMARAGVEADPARTLVTCGSQHALLVALAAAAEPGDVILVEELTYPGIRALAGLLRLRVRPVAMDAEGILPEALEDACRRANAKLLYCMPTVQNPLGSVLSAERREAVAELARRYGLGIVEDDTSGFLCADAPAPLARVAPERTTFVTSATKSLLPGLRVGWLHAPSAEHGERMAARLAASLWMAPPLPAEIAARWIADGSADAMVAWKRAEIRARRELLDRRLGAAASPSRPESGYVWLPLPEPWRGEELSAEARRRGVAVSPAESFVAGRAAAPCAVRIALGRPPSRALVDEGLRVLAELLEGHPEVARAIV